MKALTQQRGGSPSFASLNESSGLSDKGLARYALRVCGASLQSVILRAFKKYLYDRSVNNGTTGAHLLKARIFMDPHHPLLCVDVRCVLEIPERLSKHWNGAARVPAHVIGFFVTRTARALLYVQRTLRQGLLCLLVTDVTRQICVRCVDTTPEHQALVLGRDTAHA